MNKKPYHDYSGTFPGSAKLLAEIEIAIADPDGIDSVVVEVPQGLLRRASMRIRELEAILKR